MTRDVTVAHDRSEMDTDNGHGVGAAIEIQGLLGQGMDMNYSGQNGVFGGRLIHHLSRSVVLFAPLE